MGGGIDGKTAFTDNLGKITFSRNFANKGGGISGDGYGITFSGNLGDITFSDNTAHTWGGGIDGGVTFSDNKGNITFDNNATTKDCGGGISGSATFTNHRGDITFSGNTAASYGGGIDGTYVTFTDNQGNITFSGNTAATNGGGIYCSYATFTNHQGGITFSGNTAATNGGGIRGDANFSNNQGDITFISNSATNGGGIYGSATFSNNQGDITFISNSATNGGGIYGSATFSNNQGDIIIADNTAESSGGGIFCYFRTTFTNNRGDITITSNSATSGGGGYGNLMADGNKGAIRIINNVCASKDASYGGGWYATGTGNLTRNSGVILFSGNTVQAANGYGGALSVKGKRGFSLNMGGLEFSDNHVYGSSASEGGAVYIQASSALGITENTCEVVFTGNSVTSELSAKGGAIYSEGSVTIAGNKDVVFRGNTETQGDTLRLRSIYTTGKDSSLSLGAAHNGSLDIYDSIYASSETTVSINRYLDATGAEVVSDGSVRFSGIFTVDDLQAAGVVIKSTEQVNTSRTSELLSNVTVYGGTLSIETGAIVKTKGMTVKGGQTTVALIDAGTLQMEGCDFVFENGGTLALTGTDNILTCNSLVAEGTLGLNFDITNNDPDKTSLALMGGLSLGEGGVHLSLSSYESLTDGQKFCLINCYGDNSEEYWSDGYLSTEGLSGKVEWEGNSLYFTYATATDLTGTETFVDDAEQFGDGSVVLDQTELDLNGEALQNNLVVEGDSSVRGGEAYNGVIEVNNGVLTVEDPTMARALILNEGVVSGGDIDTKRVILRDGVVDASLVNDTAKVEKTTDGTVHLTQENAMAETKVNAGTLVLDADGATGGTESTVAVYSNGTLVNNGTEVVSAVTSEGGKVQGTGSFSTLTMNGGVLAIGDTEPQPTGLAVLALTPAEDVKFMGKIGTMTVEALTLNGTTLSMDITRLSDGTAYNDMLTVTGTLTATNVNTLSLTLLESTDWTAGESLTFCLFDLTALGGETQDNAFAALGGNFQIVLENVEDGVFTIDASGLGTDGSVTLTSVNGYSPKPGDTDTPTPGTIVWDSRKNGQDISSDTAGTYYISGDITPTTVKVGGSGIQVWTGSGSITGSATLTKDGKGTLTINNANTYTGGTTIMDGTLSAKNVKALGTGTVTLTGGSLHLNSLAVANAINVNGTASLKGGSKFAGNLTLTSGTLSGDAINLASGKTATLKAGTMKNVLSGAGKVAKDTSGTVYLYGTNTYTGGTTVKAGTLSAKNVKALGTGTVTLTGGTLHLNSLALANTINSSGTTSIKGGTKYAGNLTLTKGTLSGDKINLASGKSATLKSGSLKNVLAGAGKVVKDTTGTSYLFGTNTYTGGTTVKAGTLSAKNVKALGTKTVTLNAGTLHLNSLAVANAINANGTTSLKGGTKYAGNLTLTKGTLTGDKINLASGKTATLKSGTVKNVLAGAGKVVKDTAGTAYLYGANTYTGGTTVKAGTLAAKNAKALGTKTTTLTGGTLHLNSLAVANDINVNGTSAIKGGTKYKGKLTLTKGTLTGDKINLTSGKNAYLKTGTVKNALGGNGHVYKQGTGTVTLAGTNNWTGNTYVQGGSLVISGATTLRGTTRTYSGSKLDIRKAVTMGNLYLGGGTLAVKPGNMLTVTGTLTLANATKLALNGLTASNSILIKYGKLSNTSKKSLAQFFGLSSAYTVTNKGGKLTIAKAGSKKGTAEILDVSPNALGQSTWGTARAARLFDHTVRDHAQAQSVALDKNRSVWFAAMSGFSHVDDTADTNIYGGAVGMQFNGTMGGNVGLAIGQTFGHISPAGASRVKQQTQHAALYGTKMLYTSATDSVSLTGTASYGTTDADHEGYDWTQHSAVLGVRGTWAHKLNNATAAYGFAGLEYLATDSECGSGSIQALQGSIGAGISHTEGRLTLHADASFTPDMVRNAPSTTVSTGRLGFELGAGASYRISDQWSVNAGYTYHNEKRSDSHEAYIGARCTF